MRTNIVIDDELMNNAIRLSGLSTKRAVVEEGLRKLILIERKKRLAEMEGKVEFFEGYDYKVMRK